MDHSCAACGKPFQAGPRAKYCSDTCKKRGSDKAKNAEKRAGEPVLAGLPVVAAVEAELEAAGRLDTVLGQAAVRLAERMHSPFDTGSALAALSKELRATMAEALKDVTSVADPVDELSARRIRKASGA